MLYQSPTREVTGFAYDSPQLRDCVCHRPPVTDGQRLSGASDTNLASPEWQVLLRPTVVQQSHCRADRGRRKSSCPRATCEGSL